MERLLLSEVQCRHEKLLSGKVKGIPVNEAIRELKKGNSMRKVILHPESWS